MLVQNLIPLALLAGTAVAKPVARSHLTKRQYTNSSISGITQTSTDARTPTTTDTTHTCSSTYSPSEDEDCSDIATKHGIQLSDPEAKYDSTSSKCETILRGYGICPNESTSTTSSSSLVTAAPSHIPALNGTSSNSTVNGTLPLNSTTTIPSNTTANATVAHAGLITLTELNKATLTYTEGTGSATRERVVVVTHTTIDVITETDSSTPRANGYATDAISDSPSPSPSTAALSPSAFVPASETAADSSTFASSSTIPIVDASSLASTTTMSGAIANSGVAMASMTASSCAATVPPPASTQTGIVSGCTEWYVAVPGDYCATVADRYGLPVDTFMAWNPAVNPPTCPSMLAGSAYCVATCDDASAMTSNTLQATPSIVPSSMSTMTASTSLSVPAIATSSTAMVPLSSTSPTNPASPSSSSSTDVYTSYLGDGSAAAGWPAMDRWIDFDSMFAANEPDMKESCAQWGVPNDSDTEISQMKRAIQQIGAASRVDPRFILAIIMQESTGCVRVITTQYSVFNPGLMQSHNGTGSCNENNVSTDIPTTGPYISNGVVQTPCPQTEIAQMIKDGTRGTSSGDGLEQLLQQQTSAGFSGVEAYYRTARAYNGGSVAASGRLEDGCCTRSYASDVANRLTGWVNAPRSFSG